MKSYKLKTESKKVTGALASFFQELMENEVVDSLLVPQEVDSSSYITMTLVTESKSLNNVNPLAPVAMVNAARVVSKLTVTDPGQKVGVVLRSCEIRALIELIKLQQANLDNLLIIGVDCLGTFAPQDYKSLVNNGNFELESWLVSASSGETGKEDKDIRFACSMCSKLEDPHADITIGWVGVDISKELIINVDEQLVGYTSNLSLEEAEDNMARQETIQRISAERDAIQQEKINEFSSRITGITDMIHELDGCIGCYNCRQACPICFCQECIFVSPVLKNEPEEYFELARKKNAIEMPSDKLLFHITRINHMAVSCVGCGHCESVCPNDLPLTLLFSAAGKNIQEIFDYTPARDVREELPLTIYRENELESQ